MAQKGRAVLKEYFETGDVPTEAEFIDLIDSFYNFEDDNDILIQEISHSQLRTLISGSLLIGGRFYEIMDHATKYNQCVTNIVKTASVEPLIVIALSKNKISKEVRSKAYPEDIIYYNIDDILCEDGVTARKGKIYYREDTITGNSTGFDFRELYYARGKCDHALYNPATTYVEKNLVRIAGDGIYISVENENKGNPPASSPNKWWKILDLSVTEYWGWDSNCNGISFDIADTIEVPTFWILGEETNSSGIVLGTGVHGGVAGSGFVNMILKSAKIREADLSIFGGDLSVYNYQNSVFLVVPNNNYETVVGNVEIGNSKNLEEEILSINNTYELKYIQNWTFINLLKNVLGDIRIDGIINNLFNVTSFNSYFTDNIYNVQSCYFSGFFSSKNNISQLFNNVMKGAFYSNNINELNVSIIDDLKHNNNINASNLNLKDATHIKSSIYTKTWFKDFAGTQKISYINASDVIQYALPTA